MGICRDTWGKLSYTAVNKYKGVFSVTKGDNRIIKHEPWYRTDAMWMLDSQMAFWDNPPKFESFIQAVRWLKEHKEELL